MNDDAPSLKQLNRTFIGSVLFIDIVGYSTRTVPDQLEMKELFNALLAEAVQNVAPGDRIMVDTGDGAGIAFLGDPEDALFAALSLRDAIEAGRVTLGEPGFVRMGINLGPLKIVRDINGHTNMIGDGVNDAQRVMSFSEPGQVMVSHSYFDIISRFSRDYAKLFVYEGTRQDKHVREHEVYRFGPPKEDQTLADKLRDRSRARHVVDSAPAEATPAVQAAAPARSGALRPGLIATAIGAATLVGAVWSWTSKPEASPPAAAVAPAPPAPETVAPKTAAKAEASRPADVKLAARQPEGAAEKASATVSASASTDAADKAAKPAEPPAKPGTVRLAVQPWGEVYVDGAKRGVSPPMKSLSLAPGKHRIEIRNGEFAPYKETLDIKSGTETTVQYVF
ncbi:MAG TPA: adenylate/guanylate cyclase domain-containing protein [Noviherbaspirillum sp.]|uniref:adenylate/guanylate cyclase domain-containing protein n=1 Tax=Noviherbaspirillum sp. TaxID=1926288 RepID=UPI002D4B72E0|nr:adenylate/guanylate cyclase domain-containing protein [Noviherbaspirillum sp.]HYD95042.1 adenylate/guanylate cyclase domain-containing protein [Noviherbaspirillum sp.]